MIIVLIHDHFDATIIKEVKIEQLCLRARTRLTVESETQAPIGAKTPEYGLFSARDAS